MRERILLNDKWHFHKGDIEIKRPSKYGPMIKMAKTERERQGPAAVCYNDHIGDARENVEYNGDRWDLVTLPHDYVICGTPDESENSARGYLKYDNAWYRRHIIIPREWENERITLFFEGVTGESKVYFNGVPVKYNYCGYIPFEIDVTDIVRFDTDNVISVYVNVEHNQGWWYEGGGIYRNVWLERTNRVCVDTYGVYVRSEKVNDKEWDVHFEYEITNTSYEDKNVIIKTTLYDDNGALCECETDLNVSIREISKTSSSVRVSNPKLWNVYNANLYTVETSLYTDGAIIDTYITRTGFRHVEMHPEKGLYINGTHTKIKGVCGHADFGLTGKAVADNINRYKIQLIKEMGGNGYRSHYPVNDAVMDALDELGFVAIAENRWFDSSMMCLDDIKMMVKRDRNRPSVFFWSLGNEEPDAYNEWGERIFDSLKAEIKKYDKTRPVTMALCKYITVPDKIIPNSKLLNHTEVIGVNYSLVDVDEIHRMHPDKPIVSAENCASGTTRGWYYDDCVQMGHLSARDKGSVAAEEGYAREGTWKFISDRDFVMGGYQWISFDHRGETMWPRLSSQSGAFNMFLQKKDAFYQNQSHWLDTPMIHMLPHWNIDTAEEGENISLWIYTNCDETEIILNGTSLGRKKVNKPFHQEWTVPYHPGKIQAIGYINGEKVAEDVNETTTSPVALKLELQNDVKANGQDVALLFCYAVDEMGRTVPDASPVVSFHTNLLGEVAGTGSDVSDHTPVTSLTRKMYAGLISVAVKVKDIEGELKVYAQSENLKGCSCSIKLKK